MANELNNARWHCQKTHHVMVHAARAATRAGRLALECVNARYVPNWASLRANIHYTLAASSGRLKGSKGEIKVATDGRWHVRLDADPIDTDKPIPVHELDENAFWGLLMFPIIGWLRSRYPHAFKAGAGAFDWKAIRCDNKGRPVGKDGKALGWTVTEHVDPASGKKTISKQRDGEFVLVTDGYDELDWLEHSRARVGDWADACRLLSQLVTMKRNGSNTAKRARSTKLTSRERQVKMRLDMPQSQVEIAEALGITEGRVSQIVDQIERKEKAKRSRSVGLGKALPLRGDYSADDTTSKRIKRQRK